MDGGRRRFAGPWARKTNPGAGAKGPRPWVVGAERPRRPPTGRWNFYGPTHPSAIPFRPEFRLTMAAACIDLSGPGFGSDPAALLVVPMAPFFVYARFLA